MIFGFNRFFSDTLLVLHTKLGMTPSAVFSDTVFASHARRNQNNTAADSSDPGATGNLSTVALVIQ